MPGVGHTNFRRGKRILVILKDGSTFVAKFHRKSSDSKSVLFFDHDPIELHRVRALSIYIRKEGDQNE